MKIAVVGGCGSGKTTVVDSLRLLGYDAYVVGQEHSGVADLWRRRTPDALVYLDVTLDAVRQRRGSHWPEWLYKRQYARLQSARESADVRLNTANLTVSETVQEIIRSLPAPA